MLSTLTYNNDRMRSEEQHFSSTRRNKCKVFGDLALGNQTVLNKQINPQALIKAIEIDFMVALHRS